MRPEIPPANGKIVLSHYPATVASFEKTTGLLIKLIGRLIDTKLAEARLEYNCLRDELRHPEPKEDPEVTMTDEERTAKIREILGV